MIKRAAVAYIHILQINVYFIEYKSQEQIRYRKRANLSVELSFIV